MTVSYEPQNAEWDDRGEGQKDLLYLPTLIDSDPDFNYYYIQFLVIVLSAIRRHSCTRLVGRQ